MGRLSPIVHVWFSCEMVSVAGALQGQQNKQDPPQSTAMCSRPFLGIAVAMRVCWYQLAGADFNTRVTFQVWKKIWTDPDWLKIDDSGHGAGNMKTRLELYEALLAFLDQHLR